MTFRSFNPKMKWPLDLMTRREKIRFSCTSIPTGDCMYWFSFLLNSSTK